MKKRLIVDVVTPLGERVTLTRDRWREITKYKHPAMMGHEDDVRQALLHPLIIKESQRDGTVHLYYREDGGRYICVVTAPSSPSRRFVVTAYFTENIKAGRELWKK